ncbi:MAG: hypothetical protein ACYSUQ_15295 [Planctomycetota bacterium]|jgi:hypothetical protein
MRTNKRTLLQRIQALLERSPGEVTGSYDLDTPQGVRVAFRSVLERQEKILRLLKDTIEMDRPVI